MERNHYYKIDAAKLVYIEEKALEKLEANKERPLSEACIEARTVLEVILFIREESTFTIEKGACWY